MSILFYLNDGGNTVYPSLFEDMEIRCILVLYYNSKKDFKLITFLGAF